MVKRVFDLFHVDYFVFVYRKIMNVYSNEIFMGYAKKIKNRSQIGTMIV